MTSTRDRSYWDDAFAAFFVQRGFGTYAECYDAFAAAFADFRDFRDQSAQDDAREQCLKRIATRFRKADEHEDAQPMPTPVHLRAQFLPLHVDVPPLSPSVSAFDGQGRLSIEAASPKQHRQHHRNFKLFHKRGAAYRETGEQQWGEFIEIVKSRLPHVEHIEALPLREVLALLTEARVDREAKDGSEAPPPL